MMHLFPIRDDATSKSFMFVGCLCCLLLGIPMWEAVMLSNRTVSVIITELRMANRVPRPSLVFVLRSTNTWGCLMRVSATVCFRIWFYVIHVLHNID